MSLWCIWLEIIATFFNHPLILFSMNLAKVFRVTYEAFDKHYLQERSEFEIYVPAACIETARAYWENQVVPQVTEWDRHKILSVSEVAVDGHTFTLEKIAEDG